MLCLSEHFLLSLSEHFLLCLSEQFLLCLSEHFLLTYENAKSRTPNSLIEGSINTT